MAKLIGCVACCFFVLIGCALEATQVDEIREEGRHSYSVEVEQPYQQLHATLFDALVNYGWGDGDVHIQQYLKIDRHRGTMWSYMGDPGSVYAFLLDIEATGPDSSRITVYPHTAFFARKSRQWLDRTLADD